MRMWSPGRCRRHRRKSRQPCCRRLLIVPVDEFGVVEGRGEHRQSGVDRKKDFGFLQIGEPHSRSILAGTRKKTEKTSFRGRRVRVKATPAPRSTQGSNCNHDKRPLRRVCSVTIQLIGEEQPVASRETKRHTRHRKAMIRSMKAEQKRLRQIGINKASSLAS